jgi:sugar lactone lactonase YvrE
LAIDWVNNKVYVADANNNRVLRYSYPLSSSSVPELVFGQSNFTDSTSGLTANKFNRPIAVKVDNMGRLWVADAQNRRVLWFNNAHSISSNQPNANGVLGQANFTENLTGCSQNQFAGIRGIELDQFSNLYVADYSNNRVLRFDNAALKTNGADADAVFGQLDFDSNLAATTANGFENPSSVSVIGTTLWVTDQKNNRTLKFNNANTVTANPTAAAVLGQSNFTTGTLATTASGQNGPFESFADAKGNLWVVDAANNRVLIYNSANSKSNGAAADLVLGQGSFTTKNPFTSQSGLSQPRAVVVHPQDLSVWVSDAGNHRILGYESVLPLVSHEAVSSSSVGAYSAVLNGELDGDLIAEAGFVWSSSNNMPTVSDNKVRASGVITDGSLSVWVQNLPAETTIYFRSYAVNPVGISYSAASSFTTGAATDFAVSNGQAATFVIGQTNFTNRVLSLGDTGLNAPRGIAIDAKNGKLYVSDSKNNRVLRFAYPLSDTIGASAELVFGQSDFVSSTSGNTSNRFNDPRGLAVDNQGRLWVCDFANNRVVWFNNAHSISSNQPSANGVFGNSAFGVRSTAKTAQLYRPSSVVVDNDGNLWVADSYHHRVLRFNNAALKLNGANADAVLGQSDFVTVSSGLSQSAFNEPTGLDIKGDTLYVADSKNNRVLRFNGASLKANGANADAVLGQSNFTSNGTALTQTGMNLPRACAVDAEGTLWVGDDANRRILGYFEARTAGNGGSADVVLGQANFTTSVLNVTASRTSSNFAIAVDPERRYLFSADRLRRRVLGFALEGISGGPRKEAPVQEQTLRRELVAYPNPTSGSIRFDFGLMEGETYDLVIFDMAGRSVWTASQQGNMDQSVDLTGLPKGIYLAKFNTSQGYQSTVRIVVE